VVVVVERVVKKTVQSMKGDMFELAGSCFSFSFFPFYSLPQISSVRPRRCYD
jgi:hypothetical protein